MERHGRRMYARLQRPQHHACSHAQPDAEPGMIAVANDNYGIVIAGHGSRDLEGVREFETLVERVKERSVGRVVTYGFLEFARPTIDDAVRANIDGGARRVAVVPGILLAATHAKNDMP